MAEIKEPNMNADAALKFAVDLARLADQTRCHNVILLDVRQKSPVTKFFLIVTGTSDRQRRTVGDELVHHGKLNSFPAWRTNGYETAKWIVVDFIDVVAHIFEEASRNFYDLEMLWGDCPRVQWQQPGQPVASVSVAPAEPAMPDAPLQVPMAEILAMAEEAALAAQAADNAAGLPGESEVEEFVDQQMLMTESEQDGEIVESADIEIIAVRSPLSKPSKPGGGKPGKAKPRAKPTVQPRRPAAKLVKAAKTTKASMLAATRKKPAATAVKPMKSKKLVKAKAAKATKTARTTPPQKQATVKKPVAKKTIAKKAPVPTALTKKNAVKKVVGKSRTSALKSRNVPAAKKKGKR
jgi:ribosome-associated protein